MKLTHLIAAGLLLSGLGVSSAASAQDHRDDRYEQRGDRGRDRHDHRGDDRRHYGWERGDRHGWNGPRGRHCRTEWRHHRRVTVCYR